MNTNSNYMRKPSAEPPNPNKEYYYNNYQYGKGRGYSNRDKHNWNNFNNFYAGEKKEDNEFISKPMFTNSKLENHGNPEGNFVKIDLAPEEKKHINLTNIGEVPINNNAVNSLLTIKSLLIGKDSEKKENQINSDENKSNSTSTSTQISNNSNSLNNDASSLPWRGGSTFRDKEGGGFKKDYYNKTYRNNKKDYYYYSNGKNYNKNRYSLNQPQSKKSNKFD